MAELAYAQVSEACAARLEGSTPSFRTIFKRKDEREVEESVAPTNGRKSALLRDSHANARPEASVFRRERKAATPSFRNFLTSRTII